MKIKCGAQKSECTFILAHHLLSKLAVSSFYKMDSRYKTQHFTCPCQCGIYIVILALVCFIQTHPNFATKYMKKTLKPFKLINVKFTWLFKWTFLILKKIACCCSQLCKPFTYTVINFIGTTQSIFQPTGASLKNGTCTTVHVCLQL